MTGHNSSIILLEKKWSHFYNSFLYSNYISLNCTDVSKNSTQPLHHRILCYLRRGAIYGEQTQILTEWIFTDNLNSGQRGFDCIKQGFETEKSGELLCILRFVAFSWALNCQQSWVWKKSEDAQYRKQFWKVFLRVKFTWFIKDVRYTKNVKFIGFKRLSGWLKH